MMMDDARIFTRDEANRLLPWLEERFAAMAPLRAELVARQWSVSMWLAALSGVIIGVL